MESRLARLEYADLYRMKWILGGLLGLLSLWNIFALDLGFDWLTRGAAFLMMGAVLWPPLTASLPGWVWRLQTPVIVVFVVSDFILAGGDFIPPLVRMVVLLTLLRTLQPRTRREDLQLVVLTLLLVIVSGVLTLELSFAVQLAFYTPVVMLFLFVINLSENFSPADELPVRPWRSFRWHRFLRDVRGLFDGRLVAFSGLLFAGMMASASFLFLSLPRFELGQSLPFLSLPARGTFTGFSENITYGDVVSIINDDSVAFRADVGGTPPPMTPYWRMLVLDQYTPKGFSVSKELRDRGRSVSNNHVEAPAVLRQTRSGEPWTIYFEGGVSRFLPLPGAFGHARFPSRQDVIVGDSMGTMALKEASGTVFFYQMTGLTPTKILPIQPADAGLLGAGRGTSADPDQYPSTTLGVPTDEATQRVLRAAVATLLGGDSDRPAAETFGRPAVALLQAGRGYSLETEIPAGEGDILTRWMDSQSPGHCELYAGAFVLLARQAGYPARVVVGFQGGDWNGFENYYMVRNRHAHAWAEVFDAERGWLHFEPTPGSGLGPLDRAGERASGSELLEFDRTWAAYRDSLRVLWYRRVVNFDREQQNELVSGMRTFGVALGEVLRDALNSAVDALRSWFGGPWDVRHVLILLRNIAIAVVVWVVVRVSLRWLSRRFRILKGTARTRARAGKWLRRLRAGTPSPSGLSGDGNDLVATLLQIRYGAADSWPEVDTVFREARRVLRGRRRSKLIGT